MLARVILKSIPSFDCELQMPRQIEYEYHGQSVVSSELNIYNSTTGDLVFSSTDNSNGAKRYHQLEYNSYLTNGNEYYAVLYVDDGGSTQKYIASNEVNFICASMPTISFINGSEIINTSSYEFSFGYQTDDNDFLANYTVTLYQDGNEVYNSGSINSQRTRSNITIYHTVNNLPEGQLELYFSGETSNGIQFSEKQDVTVDYDIPSNMSLVSAENNASGKNIKIQTSFKLIVGTSDDPDSISYVGPPFEIRADLRNTDVTFDNVDLQQDFTLWIDVQNYTINKRIIRLIDKNGFEIIIAPFFEDIYVQNKSHELVKKLYFVLTATNNNIKYKPSGDYATDKMTVTAVSNYIYPGAISSFNYTESEDGKIEMNYTVKLRVRYIRGRFDIQIVSSQTDSVSNQHFYLESIPFNNSTDVECIDTGYVFTRNSRIEVDFMYGPNDNNMYSFGAVLGVVSSGEGMEFCIRSGTAYILLRDGAFSYAENVSCNAEPNKKHTVVIDRNKCIVDGEVIARFSLEDNTTFIGLSDNLYIGAINDVLNGTVVNSQTKFVGQIFGVRIFENGILVKNLIPTRYYNGREMIGLRDFKEYPVVSGRYTEGYFENSFEELQII